VRNVVFLFPGAWGNDSPERVLWWFEHQVVALRTFDPQVEIVPIVYRGATFEDIVTDVVRRLCARQDSGIRPVALAYSMGRQVLAGVVDLLETASAFKRVAHIGGVPRHGVPVLGTLDVFLAVPSFMFRAFGGTVMPANIDEVNRIMCGGQDAAHAAELLASMSPERMWWKVAHLFLPGARVTTEPIKAPTFVTLGTRDIFVRNADYSGDNVIELRRPDAYHGLIRIDPASRPDLRAIWDEQARFLLEA